MKSKKNRGTVEQETAAERYVFSPDLLLYRSTALFLLRKNRGERIRTFGLLVPNQALYQAELRPGIISHGFL
jgi:hypothetical protein